MASKPLAESTLKAAVDTLAEQGTELRAAAVLGIPRPTFQHHLREAARRGITATAPVPDAFEVESSDLGDRLLALLQRAPLTMDEMTRRFESRRGQIIDAIDDARAKGHRIEEQGGKFFVPSMPNPAFMAHEDDLPTYTSRPDGTYLFGACGDNHLCVPGGATVTTDKGVVRIRELKIGDLVLTHMGRFQSVLEIMRSPGNRPMVRLRCRGDKRNGANDNMSLVCTENHPVLVVRDGVEGFIPAGEVREGDCLRAKPSACKICGADTLPWATVCREHDPFVRAIHDGAKRQRYEQVARTGGSRHWRSDILPEMARWQDEGYRCIPVERARPDFIAIKDGEVVAVEVEAPSNGIRPRPMKDKYDWVDHRKYYDRVEWIEVDRRSRKSNFGHTWLDRNEAGFIGLPVTKVERFTGGRQALYNLRVAEDETFVVKGFVVHNCSKYARLDVLESLYDIYAAEGVDRVFNTGNWIDGEARFNTHDLLIHGMDAQLRYLAKNYPQRAGIHTYAVAGDDHEGWYAQKMGIDIGRRAEATMREQGRIDWHNLGYMEAHIRLVHADSGKSAILAVVHPGGGSSYALSYSIQKIIESLDGGEKPAVGLYGHYHKLWAGNIRNVWCVQTGTTEDQTPFMRKKKLEAHVGGTLIKLTQDPRTGAITRCQPEMMRYFNRGFYNNRWNHGDDVTHALRSVA
jgi:hypothetical protein